MEYSPNDICNLQPLWDFDSNKKYNVICSCLFKMYKGYKNFDKYVNGLKLIIDYLNTSTHDYKFRIFIDDHVYKDTNIMKLLRSSDKIQCVLFKCSNYMKGNHHVDVFGALVRYFPLFDFVNNDTKKVIILDVDSKKNYLHYIDKIIENNTDHIIVKCDIYKNIITTKNNKFYVSSGLIVFNETKYDHKILINFIKSAHNDKSLGNFHKRYTPFGYGTDELFLNNHLFYKVITNIYSMFYYDIFYLMEFEKKYIFTKYPKRTTKILKYIYGKYNDSDNNTPEKLYDFGNKLFRHVFKTTDMHNYMTIRFLKILKHLEKHKKIWLNKNSVNIINKYFNNIVHAIVLIKANNNTIIDIITIDPQFISS